MTDKKKKGSESYLEKEAKRVQNIMNKTDLSAVIKHNEMLKGLFPEHYFNKSTQEYLGTTRQQFGMNLNDSKSQNAINDLLPKNILSISSTISKITQEHLGATQRQFGMSLTDSKSQNALNEIYKMNPLRALPSSILGMINNNLAQHSGVRLSDAYDKSVVLGAFSTANLFNDNLSTVVSENFSFMSKALSSFEALGLNSRSVVGNRALPSYKFIERINKMTKVTNNNMKDYVRDFVKEDTYDDWFDIPKEVLSEEDLLDVSENIDQYVSINGDEIEFVDQEKKENKIMLWLSGVRIKLMASGIPAAIAKQVVINIVVKLTMIALNETFIECFNVLKEVLESSDVSDQITPEEVNVIEQQFNEDVDIDAGMEHQLNPDEDMVSNKDSKTYKAPYQLRDRGKK